MATTEPVRDVRAAAAARPECAPTGFCCALEEQPSFLVPQRLLRQHRGRPAAHLVVNPQVWFSWSGAPPREVAPWLAAFSKVPKGWATAWVSDPATGAVLPFWLGPELRALLDSAAPGSPAPPGIEPRLRPVLEAAHILVAPRREQRRLADWRAAVESASRDFERGYTPVAGLLHPYHVGALRQYFRRRIRTGALRLGDDQSALRHVAHNEPVAQFFHHQLAGAMSRIAGEPVKPSYVYFASYQGGAELERHTDREQCEFSLTYCLDYTPEPSCATDWPIHLDTPNGTVTVYQAIGDGLVYRGCKLPHYRKRLWSGATSSSIFFHFVRQSFSGRLH